MTPWLIGTMLKGGKIGAPGAIGNQFGTRASANTSGPDFNRGLAPAKLRNSRSAPNEENLFLLPDRPLREAMLLQMTTRPFDLMSRRHPLSSTRAVRFNQLRKANCPEGSRDVPASSRRQFFWKRKLLLLLDPAGLPRSLLHCALRFLCLLSFLGHVALLM